MKRHLYVKNLCMCVHVRGGLQERTCVCVCVCVRVRMSVCVHMHACACVCA